jgi:alpha-beta hydrolase superfamily lysophospholipase
MRRLLVLVHGWMRTPQHYRGLLQAFRGDPDLADCDLLPWGYRAGRLANTDPAGVAQALASEINRLDSLYGYHEIFLIGHSVGGVIVRAALLDGMERGHAWAIPDNKKVRRIVLLASTNRGFQPPNLVYRLGTFAARHSVWPVSDLILSMLRGGPFVTGVRLRWLRQYRGAEPPETVQILGTRDPVVRPDDSADLFRYANSVMIRVDADHVSIVPTDSSDPTYPYIVDALLGPLAGKHRPSPPAPRSRVVFLLHGIRDYGPWLDDLRKEVLRLDPDAEVLPVRYGYFKLINFLAPSLRASKVRDFVDRYAQELAKQPDIPFAVAGHSNGTYILGHALKDVPGVAFERAYLAGCVLPDDFPWDVLLETKVAQVRNDAARSDWVVALICGTLSWLPFYRDLGLGGFTGFQRLPPDSESRYLPGGHGAALSKDNLTSIAEFLVRGRPTALTDLPTTLQPWLDRGSRGLFWVLLALIAVALLLIWVAPTLVKLYIVYIVAVLAALALIVLIAY